MSGYCHVIINDHGYFHYVAVGVAHRVGMYSITLSVLCLAPQISTNCCAVCSKNLVLWM